MKCSLTPPAAQPFLLGLAALTLLCACQTGSIAAPPEPPSTLVVFGDSLSDQGNMFALARELTHLEHLHMSSPPASHQGKAFTNQRLAVEYVAEALGATLRPAWEQTTSSTETADQTPMNAEILDLLAPSSVSSIKNPPSPTSAKASETTIQFAKLAHHTIKKKYAQVTPVGLNFAVAGAAIANDYSGLRLHIYNAVALDKQVHAYASRADHALIKQSTFIFFIGGNDLINVFSDSQFQTDDDRQRKVASLPALMIENIQRIRTLGAKRILIIGPPDISIIPTFINTPQASLARALSQQLQNDMEAALNQAFPAQAVLWLPMQSLFAEWLQTWPAATRNSACVTDIEAGYYELGPLLEREELAVKFVNGCTQQRLEQQQFPFYDSVHPSEKIHKEFALSMLRKIKEFKPD